MSLPCSASKARRFTSGSRKAAYHLLMASTVARLGGAQEPFESWSSSTTRRSSERLAGVSTAWIRLFTILGEAMSRKQSGIATRRGTRKTSRHPQPPARKKSESSATYLWWKKFVRSQNLEVQGEQVLRDTARQARASRVLALDESFFDALAAPVRVEMEGDHSLLVPVRDVANCGSSASNCTIKIGHD